MQEEASTALQTCLLISDLKVMLSMLVGMY